MSTSTPCKSPAESLVENIATRLRRRGFDVSLEGTRHLSGGDHTLLAHVLTDGRLRIACALVWNGHSHVVDPQHTEITVTPGSRRADPTDLTSAIVARIRAREAARAACPHRRGENNTCPECGQVLPTLPRGMEVALAAAENLLSGRGIRGHLRVRASGQALMVTWHSGVGSRTDIERDALHMAEVQLQNAKIDAVLLPNCPWVHVTPAKTPATKTAEAA